MSVHSIAFKDDIKKDLDELSQLINVPKAAYDELEKLNLSEYSNMKCHEVSDLCIQLANIKKS